MLNTFTEGTEPGGLNNSKDIKVLICYILLKTNFNFTEENICEITQEKSLANYFEVLDAIHSLRNTGHINLNKENNTYEITKLGCETVKNLETELPLSIRKKSIESAQKLILKLKNLKNISTEIIKKNDGYCVECKILDIGSDLLKITIFVASLEQAQKVKEKFLENPKTIYENILIKFDLI